MTDDVSRQRAIATEYSADVFECLGNLLGERRFGTVDTPDRVISVDVTVDGIRPVRFVAEQLLEGIGSAAACARLPATGGFPVREHVDDSSGLSMRLARNYAPGVDAFVWRFEIGLADDRR